MRKQYHFRHSPQGLLAWDVDRLIALTAGLKTEALPLDQIRELDEPYWYGPGGALPTCRSVAEHMRLVQAADLRYPIIVCPQGYIMDGMHRVVKAWLEGRDSIKAYRLTTLPEPDFVGVPADDLPYERR